MYLKLYQHHNDYNYTLKTNKQKKAGTIPSLTFEILHLFFPPDTSIKWDNHKTIARTRGLSSGRRLTIGLSENVVVEMSPGQGAASRGDSILHKGAKKSTKLGGLGKSTTKQSSYGELMAQEAS